MNYKKFGIYAGVFVAGAAAAALIFAGVQAASRTPSAVSAVSTQDVVVGNDVVPAAPAVTAAESIPAAAAVPQNSAPAAARTPAPAAASSVPSAPVNPVPAGELQNYFKALNDANSSVYIVQAGDNLTKISKQQNVTVGLIMAANNMPNDRLKVGMKLRIPKEPLSLVADKSTKTLVLEAGGRPVKSYRIGLGKDNSTPVGQFKIVNRLKNPTWYYEGKVIPFGSPENPLGTRWLGFDLKSYGLHGTNEPNSIGKDESMGCIRMLNPDVEELFELVPTGTPIRVVESGAVATA